jgi:DNA gyrase/topoisomerase IV subunit B
MAKIVSANWKQIANTGRDWLESVFQRADQRHHIKADADAQRDHERNKRKLRIIPGLLDATSKIRKDCQLLILEGDSAKNQISEVRDPSTTAAIAMSGKMNNVHGYTIAQILKMEKLSSLLLAIGLTPGKPAVRTELQYGKLCIASDADMDGNDIFCLLINLLFQCWPELFDPNQPPYVYRLVAPNICAIKGKQRIHFPNRSEYELVKSNYSAWEIRYYKGLGSMNKEDWKMILSGQTDTLIPIIDDGLIGQVLQVWFGDDEQARKKELS